MSTAAPTGPDDSSTQTLLSSFAMIIFSEIGDKTFLIAAILAMRHPRMAVFAGAFLSLALMSVLSAALGHILPTLVPKAWTQLSAAALFFVFGWKMLKEGREMQAGSGKIEEEMREAEEEIEDFDAKMDGTGAVRENGEVIPLETLEEGGGNHANGHATPKKSGGIVDGARNLCSFLFGPVLVQAFVLTFLGEWGDRSQIATIALGAAHNVWLVSFGTIVGHSCCTALAVLGGRYVSTKISVKHVTLGGAVLFLLFGLIYLYEAFRSWTADIDGAHQLPGGLDDAPHVIMDPAGGLGVGR
ncbi:vacuole protein [Punctularia strigosozonata HHB-11173 SS5]|uniref:vacuole protein n=1 Tax=Punctularia strigosozonata (strain HHB-11173) TaxID=741275 RepID=UPI0004417735|nr:vacuole protein [Punctularia strigosozonata HHB-11173 SS5]EIN13113.1 vacuole protein [Punctularia strigosozonata HHB-11173 SS5]